MSLSATSNLSSDEQASFIAWPGWDVFKTTASLSAVFFVIFCVVYGLTDFITHLHDFRIDIQLAWEQQLPLITWMSVIYLSISPMLLLAPFVIRDIKTFKMLFKVMVTETLIAAVFFLALPVKLYDFEATATGVFSSVYHLADFINLTYNELPSLHVAFAFTVAYFYGDQLKVLGKSLLFLWAMMVALSTLFTHQHELIGTLAGIILAWTVITVYLRHSVDT